MREPRQIVLVHRTLANKARQDVLRSSTARHIARQAPILSQTCLNSPHTSRQVKMFCRLTKNRLNKMVSQQILTTVMTSIVVDRVHTTLNHIRFVFYHNIKDNKRNLSQDLLTIENTVSDLKVYGAFFLSKFNLLAVFTYDLHFSNSILLLLSQHLFYPSATFVISCIDVDLYIFTQADHSMCSWFNIENV